MTNCPTPAVYLVGTDLVRAGVPELLERLELPSPICIISAGWQEWEGTLVPLPPGLRDLALHRRAEAIFKQDRELRAEHRARQRHLMRHQSAYNLRLMHSVAALDAVRKSRARAGAESDTWIQHEDDAMKAIRALDRQHLRNTRRAQRDFHERWNVVRHAGLDAERKAIAAITEDCATVLIAGGHVAVLLNRLRLFAVSDLLVGKTVVAWGAGAMAMADQVMLYDDHAPQGPRVPEVLEDGLGRASKTVLLPDPVRRLDLSDRDALRTLAARAAPRRCIALGNQAVVRADSDGQLTGQHAHRITSAGRLRRVVR